MSHIMMYGCGPVDPGKRFPACCPICGAFLVAGMCPRIAEHIVKPPAPPAPPPTLVPCEKCKRHVVTGTLCPWCTPPVAPPTPREEKQREALERVKHELEIIRDAVNEALAAVDEALKP